MNDKYIFTDERIPLPDGTTAFRIKALKSFSDIKEGDLGGFIENEKNLSAAGNCWVYDNACVRDNARVSDSAKVHGNAEVYDDARISGHACVCDETEIYDNARISGYADIHGNVKVYGNAKVNGKAKIYDYANICGNVKIHGFAEVYEDAILSGNAMISGNAKIHGDAVIRGDAIVYDDAHIYGYAVVQGSALIRSNAVLKDSHNVKEGCCICDLSKNLIESLRLQVGLLPINGEVIAYKQVHKNLSSFHDDSFIYKVGEWVEVTDYDTSSASCAKGLHFSNPNYWNMHENVESSTILIATIKLEDIITVQAGKIRCKRAFILGTYEVENEGHKYSCE